MRRDLRIERVLPHPVERVWRVLTDKEALSAWFMRTDFEPVLGKKFTYQMKPQRGWDGLTHCEVIELSPPRLVAYTYRGEATGEKTIACAGVDSELLQSAGKGLFTRLDTVLRFKLEPVQGPNGEEHTRFVLEHQGFEGFQLVVVSFVMGFGWKGRVLKRMETVLGQLARGEAPTKVPRRPTRTRASSATTP